MGGVRAHFDGAAMGTVFSNISGLSIGLGLSLGLSIFCSQAHGAGEAALRAHLAHMREELERLYERRAAVNAEIQDMEARLGEARIEGE